VYHYANELVRRGHRVQVLQAHVPAWPQDLRERAREVARFIRRYRAQRQKWFDLDDQVALRVVPDLHEWWIPRSDAIFATACYTAPAVASYRANKARSSCSRVWHRPEPPALSTTLQEALRVTGDPVQLKIAANLERASFERGQPVV
jgi:hypothetical protein